MIIDKIKQWRQRSRHALYIGLMALLLLLVTILIVAVTRSKAPDQETDEEKVEESITEWSNKITTLLWLVDKDHILPQSYVPEGLGEVEGADIQLVEEAARAFERMCADMETPVHAANGYISAAAQQNLYDAKWQTYIDEGYSEERAQMAIAEEYFPGGQDEHQLGLTVDVCADDTLTLDYKFQSTEQGEWLMENAWRYGFVYRIRGSETSIYKPWQLRYVGETHAYIMTQLGLSLDEYLSYLAEKGSIYVSSVGTTNLDLVIYYTDSLDQISLKIKEASGDNDGHYIVTCYR